MGKVRLAVVALLALMCLACKPSDEQMPTPVVTVKDYTVFKAWGENIIKFCDGDNLVYAYWPHGGLAVVPGGCKK